jgi:hypothetical protein
LIAIRDEIINYFTICEITDSLLALSKLQNPFDVVMTFYGMIYPKQIRTKSIQLLQEKYLYAPPELFDIHNYFQRMNEKG